MIHLNFAITNPYAKDNFKNLYCRTWQLAKNKYFELQCFHEPHRLLAVTTNLIWRGYDHAGPEIELVILGYSMSLRIYDNRHWDDVADTWIKYSDEDTSYDYQ